MPATVKLQLSLESLVEAITSLDLPEKQQLLEVLEQQIFEAEEETYEDSPEVLLETQAVRSEYQAGNYQTIDEYLAGCSKSAPAPSTKCVRTNC